MSKSKPLQYTAAEPAFLQRLKAQNVSIDGRHERPVPRPRRAKVEDADDMPTYVLEGTHETVAHEDLHKLQTDESDRSTQDNDRTSADSNAPGTAVIDSCERLPKSTGTTIGNKKRKTATYVEDRVEDEVKPDDPQTKKTKKKSKAIKLSFDDE